MILLALVLGFIGWIMAGPIGALIGVGVACLPAFIGWLGDINGY